MSKEVCFGCQTLAEEHPMIGIIHTPKGFIKVPICANCFINPSHRKVNVKAHFFPRGMAKDALRRAGSSKLG